MLTSYFTFGFDHVHRVDGRTYDVDTVVRISAPDPRGVMLEKFGTEWAREYEGAPARVQNGVARLVDIVRTEGRDITYEEAAT